MKTNKYSAVIEFDIYDINGKRLESHELYKDIIVTAKTEDDAVDEIHMMDFGDKVISYINI